MDKIPTAVEFVRSRIGKGGIKSNHYKTLAEFIAAFAIEYAKVIKNAALEAAAEEAKTEDISEIPYEDDIIVNKESILNAYPDKLII